ALLGDGLLRNLHQNLLARFQQVADGRQIRGLRRGATAAVAAMSMTHASAATPTIAMISIGPASATAVRLTAEIALAAFSVAAGALSFGALALAAIGLRCVVRLFCFDGIEGFLARFRALKGIGDAVLGRGFALGMLLFV